MQTPVEHPNKPPGLRIEPVTFLLWGDAARRPPLNFYLFLKNLTPHFGILREAQKSKAMFSCRPPTADRACFICLSPPDLRERRRDGKKSQKNVQCSAPSPGHFLAAKQKYHLWNTRCCSAFPCRTRVHGSRRIHPSGSPDVSPASRASLTRWKKIKIK